MSKQIEDTVDVAVPTPTTTVRCRAKRIFEIIPKLNDAQISTVRRIGFGGLLELKFKHFPLENISLFLDCFNDGSFVFRAPKSKHFMVSKHDVHDCFLIPCGPDALELVPTGSQKDSDSPENVELKRRWRELFGITSTKAGIPLGKLKDAIEADIEGGDHFCRCFVLMCMSSFLAPTINNYVDFKLLRAVEDVSAIHRLDWCSYVLQDIVGAGKGSKQNQSSLVGCIPFLMITYFQRFDFRGEICPHDLPLIKHWDEAKLKSRIIGELADGGLGRQTWSFVKYPRCLHAPSNNSTSSTSISRSAKKFIQIEIPEGVEDDEQLKDRASDDVHLLFLKLQRNSVAFHAWYANAISIIKQAMKGSIDSVGKLPSQASHDWWQSEELHRYCDLVELNAQRMKVSVANAPLVADTGAVATKPGHDEQHIATIQLSNILCDLKKNEYLDDLPEMPTDLSCDDTAVLAANDNPQPTPVPVTSDELLDSGIPYSTAELDDIHKNLRKGKAGPSVECSTPMAEDDSDAALLAAAGYTPIEIAQYTADLVHHPFLLHSPQALQCMSVVPEKLGCSLDCGAPDPRQAVVSDFLRSRKNIFCTVFSSRKNVMDYVFSSPVSVDMMEQLVIYTDIYTIPREDMISLLPGKQVSNSVIECWCILLNHLMNSKDVPVASSRCFFGLSHAGPAIGIWQAKKKEKAVDLTIELFCAWDGWIESCFPPFHLDADMVFIPVLSSNNDHYSCACINFVTEQVEYLDNRIYHDDLATLPYNGIARLLADIMGKYLVSKGVEKGSKVSGFKLVNVPFRWQGVGYNNGDCGIYLMLHMLFYVGSVFDCGLGAMDTNDLYRAEIAAILILSDINKCRKDVLSKVDSFNEAWKKPRRMSKDVRTPLPKSEHKRLLDDDVDCEVTYKRRRGSTPSDVICPPGEPLSVLSSRRRGKGDGLGCSLNCGPVSGLGTLVVSNFLRNNQTLCKNVPDLSKHAADYAFLDDNGLPNVEVLARYGPNASIRRDEFYSMLPNVPMSSFVIECWAMLLNKIESQSFQPPRMAFLGLRHKDLIMRILDMPTQCTPGSGVYDELFMVWDVFIKDCGNTFNLEADFIFIPIEVDNHLACACINFQSKTVDILDNQSHPKPSDSIIFRTASILASAMSDYLDIKGITAGSDIPNFEHRQIMFDWVRPPALDEESGIFTIVHMLMYEGHIFKYSDLDGKKSRRYLVVQLASTLILEDANEERGEVMKKLHQWIENKESIWVDIQARRRIAKMLVKSSK